MTTPRIAQEHHFEAHDHAPLFYRHWPATHGPRRGAIVLFHPGHEHGARMAHLVDELDLPDFDFFAWDARGHGRSPGAPGHSPSFATSVRDVQTFVQHIGTAHGVAEPDIHVIAQGVGAVLVATWAHDYAPKVRGLTLASPAFNDKRYLPFTRAGLGLLHRLRGPFFVNRYLKAKRLTHDAERIASYESDPLIARTIAVNLLLGLCDAADRVVADANAITLPVQLLISGADRVVQHKPQHQFFARLGSAVKTKVELPGFLHDTLGEKDRAPAIAGIRGFILQLFNAPPAQVDLRAAHLAGATADESHALAAPLSPWSAHGAWWALTRARLRLGGKLSRGVKLGHDTGFDSASTLDYVYRNTPEGKGPLGRQIDKTYLNAVGWRGIRQRKVHVEELLLAAMERLAEQHRDVRLMDIAAGHGRCVLDAVRASPVRASSVLLRDPSETHVRDGRALIAEKELQAIAEFVQADAFDRLSLASVTPRPTLAVVSGLYELFPDNDMVRRSLAGVGDAVEDGGYLVYTAQPWHPQRERIARALTSHRQGEAEARVMRRRTQAEMDQLVEEAGFRKIDQRIDEWGIFTVSLAVRHGA